LMSDYGCWRIGCVMLSTTSEFWLITTMQMLPEIRKDLFGINENRKFYT
jgi:hypothetical protein